MEKNYQVHIDNLDQDIEVQINENESLEKLIEQIRKVLKLPFEQIDVFYENNKLDVQHKMNTFKVNNQSSLNVKLFCFIKIKVTIEKLEQCEIQRINIYDKLGFFYKKIYDAFGIQNYHLDLYHGQTLLKQHQSLYQQQILKDCELNCIVKPSFLIDYKSEIYTFITKLNDDFKKINQMIKQNLNLEQDFELIYNEQIINNEDDIYYNYSIPQNQQLELKILDSVIIIISSYDTQSFKVNKCVKIKELITYLKQLYLISDEVSLIRENQKLREEQTIQELKLKDYEVIQLEQKIKADLYLINKDNPKQLFKRKIDNPIKIEFLQNLPQFQDKVIHFYDNNQKELQIQDEIKYEQKITIYYEEISQSQIFSWIQIGFLNKQTQQKIIKKVAQNEIIDKYIKELVGAQKVYLWLGDQEITKEHTFTGIGAKNNDCIVYDIIKKSVLVVYKEQNHIIEVEDEWTFENLKQTLNLKFKDTTNNYYIIHRNVQPDYNQNIISNYNEGDIIYFTDQTASIINQSRIVDNDLIPIKLYIIDKQDEITINVQSKMNVQNLIQKIKNLFSNYASIELILKLGETILPENFQINSTHRNTQFIVDQKPN